MIIFMHFRTQKRRFIFIFLFLGQKVQQNVITSYAVCLCWTQVNFYMMKNILTKFTNSCLGPGGQSWGVRAKIVSDADKAYVSVVEVDSKNDPFYLLQYINKFSISYL